MDSVSTDFKIVAIGASAGGLESIETIFQNINSKPGMAFVVIQHLSPDFKSFMPEILARKSKMKVITVNSHLKIEPNNIYLLPPKKNMRVEDDFFILENADKHQLPNKPIDLFFGSLASSYGDRSIGVVLSGTGSDGTQGLKKIKKSGGMTYVESLETAKFDGMPRSAIENCNVDVIGSPREIALNLCGRLYNKAHSIEKPKKEIIHILGETKASIFFLIQQQYGVDFSKYKLSTVFRRLDRRLSSLGYATEEEYLSYLKESADEMSLLYNDMLIGVTKFFRDKEAFSILQEKVIPKIIHNAMEGAEVRIWTPGCASGEEPYSLAILLNECIEQSQKDVSFKIFATDIDDHVLTIAAEGAYNIEEFSEVPPSYIEKYFERISNKQFRIIPSIRKKMVFARHNVLSDPPFMNIDLVTCRNLLIYFADEAQEKALSMILFSLKMDGYLFLGPSEAIGKYKSCFGEISRHWKIFKKEDQEQISLEISQNLQNSTKVSKPVLLKSSIQFGSSDENFKKNQSNKALNLLLQTYVPPSVLVTEDLGILHTFGNMGDYFHLKPGIANLNIKNMVESRLATAIGMAVQKAIKEEKKVTYKSYDHSSYDIESENFGLKITAIPLSFSTFSLSKSLQKLFLISIEEEKYIGEPSEESERAPELSAKDIDHISIIEAELESTKENLQGTIEELETTNEELQSTNEELLASNEELQSTNEELHSVNEELYTVNSEYQSKIEELTSLSRDEENLLKSTGIGTIFLDNSLRIRKFTPAVTENFSLLPNDIGRPLEHIKTKFLIGNFSDKISEVIKEKVPLELEAGTSDGKTYSVRIFPYATEFDPADGVVVTFINITKNKLIEQELQKSNQELEDFAYITSHDLKTPMRHITHHVEILQNNLKGHLDAESKDCIDTVVHSTQKMNNMIEAIFKLSKIGKANIEFEHADLNEIVSDTCKVMEEGIKEVNAHISYSSLHKVDCEPDMISQVLQNLIQNSLKYRRQDISPEIKIESDFSKNYWYISVLDNGIGIKDNNYDRAFKLFQRVTPDESVDGLGIGLTLCKKIIEMHGGKIHMESNYGIGTKITFSLPQRFLES